MFGISYGYRVGSHTMLTLLSDCIPRKFQPIIVIFSTLVSAAAMLLIVKTGYGMVLNQLKFGQILPGMRIPMAVVGWAIPAGAAVTVVSILKAGVDEIAKLGKGVGDEAVESTARELS
jgi:TRAP-type C4-dicarboxylate transport system permease small subunit